MAWKNLKKVIGFPLFGGLLMLIVPFGIYMSAQDMMENNLTGDAANSAVSRESTIRVPDCYRPLPDGEGTIVLHVKPPIDIFEQFSDVRDEVLFFSASSGPKVEIRYEIANKRFRVGLPPITSDKIDIFDGIDHQLAYAYNEEKGQRLFIDGKLVNESEFDPRAGNALTGMVISPNDISVTSIFDTTLVVEDHELTQNEMAKAFWDAKDIS